MKIKNIPLSHLVPSPANVRKTGAATGIAELAASIEAHGLLQNLQVRCGTNGKFEVVAGARRLAALKLLAKRKTLPKDAPVCCNLLADENAIEISLAENEMRRAMHPADQFAAFKALIDAGHGPEEIAARFGVTAIVVRQRLKLAAVSPALFALYRKEEMTLDQLMAFTVSDDHAAQEAAWFDAPQWQRSGHAIRDRLTVAHVPASDRRAQFVTVDAYVAAGGGIITDLFQTKSYLADPALLDRLVAERLEREAGNVRQEGWGWIEIIPALAYDTLSRYGRAKGKPQPLPARQAKALAKAEKALETLSTVEELTDEEAARFDALEEEVTALSTPAMLWSEKQMRGAGAVVSIGPDGACLVTRGLVRPAEAKAAMRDAEDGVDAATAPARFPGLSAKLTAELTAHRTAALRALLADAPPVALASLTHALALPLFYGSYGDNGLDLKAGNPELRAGGLEDSPAARRMADTQAAWAARLPEQEDALWDWLRVQDGTVLAALLAYCVARAVKPENGNHTGQLAAALALDMAQWWQPTAALYLGRVPKTLIAEAVAEGVNRSAALNIAEMKKDAMAKRAEELLAGTGWLPDALRPVPLPCKAAEVESTLDKAA
jgi:ParB family chromosome partitioning protein